MGPDRMRQVNELLRNELAIALARDIELPEGVVASITRVQTSADLHHAAVYVSIIPENQTGTVLNMIKRKLGHSIPEIAPKLSLRSFPHLRFIIDEQARSAAHIENLLDSLRDSE